MLRWLQPLLLSGKLPKKDKTTHTIDLLMGEHRPNWAFAKRTNFGAYKVFLEGSMITQTYLIRSNKETLNKMPLKGRAEAGLAHEDSRFSRFRYYWHPHFCILRDSLDSLLHLQRVLTYLVLTY